MDHGMAESGENAAIARIKRTLCMVTGPFEGIYGGKALFTGCDSAQFKATNSHQSERDSGHPNLTDSAEMSQVYETFVDGDFATSGGYASCSDESLS